MSDSAALTPSTPVPASSDLTAQKQELLIAFYQTCWSEMTWRRNAGYRTIILGLAYCGGLLTLVAANHSMPDGVKVCLSIVIAIATLFGAGYLASNYKKYMAAAAQSVLIEQYVGAYDNTFLGQLGALMPPARRTRPGVPLTQDPISLGSILAFVAGGLITAVAILLV